MEEKNICDIAFDIDDAYIQLEKLISVMTLLLECMSTEGYQTDQNFSKTKALNFVERFSSVYHDVMDVFLLDLMAVSKDFKRGIDALYELHKKMEEGPA